MTERGDNTSLDDGGPPPPDPPSLGDAPMRSAIYMVAACALLFAMIAFGFVDARTGGGVLVGGAIATLNLVVFARVGQAFLTRKDTVPWGVVAVLKLVFLFGGVLLILKSGLVTGVSLAVGYAALPFGITLASLLGPKPPDDYDETQSARRRGDVIKGPPRGSDPPDAEP